VLLGAGATAAVRQPATAAHAAARPHTVHPVTAVPAAAPAAPEVPVPGPFGTGWLALNPPPDLDVHAESGVLVDLDTRQLMWARDERSPRPPASLTKLLTAMVAADLAGSLDRQVTVPAEATQLESDSTLMGLSPGEVVSVRELMAGVFLVSGNDAAETLARAFTDRDHFVQLMSAKAAALGMRDSHFTNPSGLDDPGLRATAYDLAVAGGTIATRYPDLLAIAGAKDQVIAETATHRAFALHSVIRLVSTYPGAGGLKTGYTDDAGYCLVGVATRGDRHLMVVLLRSDLALTVDATHLLDYGFARPRPVPPNPSAFANL
jgi:D-alanyl-D-alanine carboxypeptidase (penicillin-binding protein 5/6)